jgi:inorganic pyrophosphatase
MASSRKRWPRTATPSTRWSLPQPLRDEISHFFSIYEQPEGKHVMVDGWFPREQAVEQIESTRRRWDEHQS